MHLMNRQKLSSMSVLDDYFQIAYDYLKILDTKFGKNIQSHLANLYHTDDFLMMFCSMRRLVGLKYLLSFNKEIIFTHKENK